LLGGTLGLTGFGTLALLAFAILYAHWAPALLGRLDVNVGEVLMKQGLAYEEAGAFENARERYATALQSRFQGEQNRALTLKRLGSIYWREGDYAAALPYLDAAVASSEVQLNAYEPLCDTLYQLKEYANAAEVAAQWTAAAQGDPEQRAAALYHAGRLALAAEDRSTASARFVESDALHPGGRAASELACLYFDEGRYQDALVFIDKYLQSGASGGRAEYIRQLRARTVEKLEARP
jgi:tetratricopeptide (TPR) repeat protein